MKKTKAMALCGVVAALSVVLLWLGAVLEIGMYAAPMLAGFCLLPVQARYGKKYAVLLWLAVSLLSLILIPNPEQNLMYFALFGLYPLVYPSFQKLPGLWRMAAKLLFFNGVTVLVEALVMLVLAPQTMVWYLAAALLAVGNVVFVLYDRLLPRMERRLNHLLRG